MLNKNIFKNQYLKLKQKKEKEILNSFKSFFKKHKIRTYEDFPNVGAYIVFENLKDKVNCYEIFS